MCWNCFPFPSFSLYPSSPCESCETLFRRCASLALIRVQLQLENLCLGFNFRMKGRNVSGSHRHVCTYTNTHSSLPCWLDRVSPPDNSTHTRTRIRKKEHKKKPDWKKKMKKQVSSFFLCSPGSHLTSCV